MSVDVVTFFDCDNTLLDNDAVTGDLRAHLVESFGPDTAAEYWTIFEQLRRELGYADYLGALQRYRQQITSDTKLLAMSAFLIDYPFETRLYPGAIDAVHACAAWSTTAILSDGDVVFQPRKIQRSGLWDAVGGRVLIYIHKETMLGEVAEQFPARHYVMVDDKVRVLAAMKAVWGSRLTTVFPRQGHYATDAKAVAQYPVPDITVERIGDLANLDLRHHLTG